MASNKPNNKVQNNPEEDIHENASEAVVSEEMEALKAELEKAKAEAEEAKKAAAMAQEDAAYKARERKVEEGIVVDPGSTQNDLPAEFKREPVIQDNFMNYPGTTRIHY